MARSITVTNEYGTFSVGDDNVILSSFDAQPAEPKSYTVDLPGSDGVLDLSTALTDGITIYNNRIVTITFTVVGGRFRNYLNGKVQDLMWLFHGQNITVTDPDNFGYFKGKARVSIEDHFLYAIVTIVVDCEPYRYRTYPKTGGVNASNSSRRFDIYNEGSALSPFNLIIPEGTTVVVTQISYGDTYVDSTRYEYGAGEHMLGSRLLPPGQTNFYYTCSGRFEYYFLERDL